MRIFFSFSKKLVYFLVFMLFIKQLSAQGFGTVPPKMNWREINTDTVKVIFPNGLENQAQRVVNMVHHLAKYNQKGTIGDKVKKVDIILHNKTTVPNGFVTRAPFRSEFFMTPPQDPYILGNANWEDVLTIHEYRHVQQYNNAFHGASKLLYWLAGDLGILGLQSIAIPDWFWEGDAVVQETSLTDAGRGRLPYFTISQRAIAAENKHFPYVMLKSGSYKRPLPNHYTLGYGLVNYAKDKYGNNIWEKVFRKAVAYKRPIYPFNAALKKETGLNSRKLYNEASKEWEKNWKNTIQNLNLSTYDTLNMRKKNQVVTSYYFPKYIDNQTVVVLKTAYNEIPNIVKIDTKGKEEKLTNLGLVLEDYFSYQKDKLAWCQVQYDPRWELSNFQNIVTYDMKTGEKKQLTSKSRYFSPTLNKDATKIVAVQVNEQQQSQLNILDSEKGNVLQHISNPNGYYFLYPQWATDEKSIISIVKKGNEMALAKFDLMTGQEEILLPFSANVLSVPYIFGDDIYFSATFSGIDNIFVLKMKQNNQLQQVTNVKIGAFEPSVSPDGKNLVFSDFTSKGRNLASMPLENAFNQNIDIQQNNIENRYQNRAIAENGGNILTQIDFKRQYEVKKHSSAYKLFKVHSWGFATLEPELRLGLITQNLFNTVQGSLNTNVNFNDSTFTFSAAVNYGKLYPMLSFGVGTIKKLTANATAANRNTYNFGVQIPLSWNKDTYNKSFTFSSNYYRIEEVETKNLDNQLISRLNYASSMQKAYQQVKSRWAQSASLYWKQDLANTSKQVGVRMNLFFPGFGKNHSFNLRFIQQRNDEAYHKTFSDAAYYSRGYGAINSEKASILGLNYELPLFYPDFGINGIAFFKRLRTNIFADFTNTQYIDKNRKYNSAGIELFLDTHLFNIFEVPLGFRATYIFNENASGKKNIVVPSLILGLDF